MERTPASSSLINSIGHNKETSTLEVEFHKGGIYQYTPFTEEQFANFAKAESVGSYFLKNIKNDKILTTTKL